MANRLASELSPYLQQHAENPVEWYAWGDEALQRAKRENKPILLSIGYSACHWCHVMERESFENEEIAALMNASFVNIKVDREERPDLDKVYQLAVQLMTRRSGGWPLTVFLTPQLEPYYGGTYFPPEQRHGMPGFPTILEAAAKTFSDQREEVDSLGSQVVQALQNLQTQAGEAEISDDFLLAAARKLELNFDDQYGGFGSAPKFPSTMSLEVMLGAYLRGGNASLLERVQKAVDAMIDGGIHDQLGGGFHRYSVDARWRVPHFEKMLYDNALLARLMVDLWRVTREARYRQTAEQLLSYVEREMVSEAGGFFSSQDADSEGEEGTFFVWSPGELKAVLGDADAELAAVYFGVDDAGNFEDGKTVLHRTRTIEALAEKFDRSVAQTTAVLGRIVAALFEAREGREKPFRDEKIIASWNGLMIGAAAEAGAAFGEPRWIAMAERALDFIETHLWDGSALRRIHKDGRSQTPGFLVDYAELANAALDLYEATFDRRRLAFAKALLDQAISRFWEDGVFYFAETDPSLLVRSEDTVDHAVPSGTSSIVFALLRASVFFDATDYGRVVDASLTRLASTAVQSPFAHGLLLLAVDRWRQGATEIEIVGRADDPNAKALAAVVRGQAVLGRSLLIPDAPKSDRPQVNGQATAYVCRGRTCSAPVTDAAALLELLASRD